MTPHSWLVAPWCFLLLGVGCVQGTSRNPTAEEVAAEQIRIVEALTSPEVIRQSRYACGPMATEETPDEVFMVTADQCLGCRNVGWMLRRRARLAPSGRTIRVLVPRSDVTATCEYLAREVVSATAMSVPDSVFPRDALNGDMVYVELSVRPPRIIVASEGSEMLVKLQQAARD